MWKRNGLLLVLMASLMLSMPGLAVDVEGYHPPSGYQYVSFGRYPQGADGEVMPIVWRVLSAEEGQLYLMSDQILDVRRIDGDQWNYTGWEGSELYQWLNHQMLEAAFDEAEREALLPHESLGYISLPSVEDIRNPAYGFAKDESRRLIGTPYALEQGLYQYSGRNYSPIWTRSPSQKTHAHRSTKSGGGIGFIGVESDDLGLCPVVWLRMEVLSILSGDGTYAAPYVLSVKEAID